jgi:chemotaxis methyl-accepting protein methylase
LSKKQAESLGYRQKKGWNLLHQDNEICFFRNHQNEFKEFFTQKNDLVFCNEVCCVIEAVGQQHDRN